MQTFVTVDAKLVYGHLGQPAHLDVRAQEHVNEVSALPVTRLLWWICPPGGRIWILECNTKIIFSIDEESINFIFAQFDFFYCVYR